MKIEDMRNKNKEVTIKDIEVGECFIDWDGDLNMKIAKIESSDVDSLNAIVLTSGRVWTCDEDKPVTPVKTHIVIESEK